MLMSARQRCVWVLKILVITRKKSQAVFFRLGTANKEKGITAGVHTPVFNIDESAIETGIGIMATFGAMAQLKD